MSKEKSIQEAMSEIADNMPVKDMKVKPVVQQETSTPADAQVLVRTTVEERDEWKAAAEKVGMTLSAFVRELVNARARELLHCSHPVNMRRRYPWAEMCLQCNVRLDSKREHHIGSNKHRMK